MKKIINHLTSDWYKYLLELIVITAGVIGAFALNNWNENRKYAIEETKILNNLNTEFRENGKSLAQSIERLDVVISALDSVLELMALPNRNISESEFENLLRLTFTTPSWTPGSFVLEDIKNSGGLSRLSDDSLKYLLIDWERYYSNLLSREESYDIYNREYIEYISLYGSARNLDAISGTIPDLKRSIITSNRPDLLNEPLFENRADNFYFLATLLRDGYLESNEKLAKIIERTD